MTDLSKDKDTQAQTAAIPDANPNPVITTASDGMLKEANTATLRLLKVLGLTAAKDLLPGNHQGLIKACLKTNTPLTGQLTTTDRIIVWSYHPIEQANAVYIYGQAIPECQSDSPEMNNLRATIPTPVIASRPDGRLLFVNTTAQRLHQELALQNAVELLPWNHNKLVKACLKARTPLTEDCQVAGHTLVWSYQTRGNGDTVYSYGHDVTAYQSACSDKDHPPETSPEPVLSAGSDGALHAVNSATLLLLLKLGLKNVEDILPPMHNGLVKACLRTRMPLTDERRLAERVIVWSYQPNDRHDAVYIYGHSIPVQTTRP